MAKIFISYSRVDLQFVQQLYDLLQRMRPRWHIWYDQAPHGLLGGDSWWDEIMNAIADADIFIYVLTNESVHSKYCQAEFEEARRLQKRIITIQARDRTKLQGNLAEIQFVDMKNGVNDGVAVAQLSGALDRQAALIKKRRALWRSQTPKPEDEQTPAPRPADAPDVETPTLTFPAPASDIEPVKDRRNWTIYAAVASVIVLIVIGVLIASSGGGTGDNTPTEETSIVQIATDESTQTPSLPAETPTFTDTAIPTNTPTATETPDIIAAAQLVLQQQTAQAIIDSSTATAARATQDYELQQTESANRTATATLWTNTPTPDITASVEAVLTGWALETATQVSVDATATATRWTATPTATLTPTNTPNATATLIAFRPQTNTDWRPIERDFDGVTMVLVPVGCFMMGSTRSSDEQPVHEQCFAQPFWIDKTEVTQAQFRRLDGTQANPSRFSGDDRPVENITWFEARDFCELRGGRLPTEAEWEYAARGPESWVYPWGSTWNENNAVWNRSGSEGTANVGSIPGGVSWVGALDMIGNVREWTSSLYESYPYDTEDEGEADTDPRANVRRVLRGASWITNLTVALRATYRNGNNPNNTYSSAGFRCARADV